MREYDYLIIGAGLYGLTCARLLTDAGKKCLVIDKRNHIGGNCYTEDVDGIKVHKYGPHIFHTDKEKVWSFINKYTTLNHFSCRPKLRHKNTIYSFPINLLTLHQVYGVMTPQEALEKIEEVTKPYKEMYKEPRNAYEWGMQLVGPELYEIFYDGYLKKQWKKDPKDIPADVLKRQVFRLVHEDSYYNHPYQGMPNYNLLFDNLSEGIEIKLSIDYLEDKATYDNLANTILYTGPVDRYFNYTFGPLEYRSLIFKEERLDIKDYQGTFMMSYPESKYEFTRIIEHKHFEFGEQPFTIITKEYPDDWSIGKESFYPVNDEKNQEIYDQYFELVKKESNVIFGGRMGSYKYLNMDETISLAIDKIEEIIKPNRSLIISHYEKNTSWTNDFIKDYSIFIYNKGNSNVQRINEITTHIKLENIGREPHTYLHHIIENYDNLTEWNFFSQDDPFEHVNNYQEILTKGEDYWKLKSTQQFDKSYFFSDMGLQPCSHNGHPHDPGLPVQKNWEMIFEDPFPANGIFFSPACQYIVHRDIIRSRSKEFWIKLNNILLTKNEDVLRNSTSAGPWVFERIIPHIFNLNLKTKI